MTDRSATLLAWYEDRRRDLPWRRTRDPYRILVSEVMLQQTQVARVVPFYEAWLARFPDVEALAAAPVADVLRAWSGLGYNRRALALRAAAGAVAASGWPRTATGLRALPGVGPYTAAAVASFAFGEAVAAVDVNVRRVIARWDGVERPPAAVAARAAELLAAVPPARAADWNQALMELGAVLCTARAPRCAACPARPCAARASGGRARPAPRSAVPRRSPRVRFEDSDRFVRGRIVAALAAGEGWDARLPAGLPDARLRRALAGLERDGLVERRGGRVALPGRGPRRGGSR